MFETYKFSPIVEFRTWRHRDVAALQGLKEMVLNVKVKTFIFSRIQNLSSCFLKLIHLRHIDIDECKEQSACQCDGCNCKNKWGGFECKCSGNRLYMKEQDTCIGQ